VFEEILRRSFGELFMLIPEDGVLDRLELLWAVTVTAILDKYLLKNGK
jgi:hypothetical protein